MIELDNRAEQFLDSIREEGEQTCAAIRSKTDAAIAAALDKTTAAETVRTQKTVEFEAARLLAAANRSVSDARAKAQGALSAQRDALAAKAFEQAAAQLAAFTATADYGPWLVQSAQEMAKKLGKGAVLYARTKDMPLLKDKLPQGVTLEADDTITLGGLKGSAAQLSADDTLSARLEAQHDWFVDNAGLRISL